METAHPGRSGLCHAPAVAIVLVLLAYMVAPLMDGTAKWLSGELPVLQVVWARYVFHLLIVLPVVIWRYGAASLWPAEAGIQFLRSCFLVTSTVLFFFSISMMPLADSIALVFVYPVVITALSPLVLGERVGMRRWVAVSVGLIGTLIIIRPGGNVIGWPALLALGAGTVFACYVLMTRRLAGTAPSLVTLAFAAVVGAVIMTAIMPVVWVTPDPGLWPLLVAVGGFSALGHGLLIAAYGRAPAPVLAPFAYSEMIGQAAVGLVVFGDFPDSATWLGIAVITAAGIYISVREGAAAKAA